MDKSENDAKEDKKVKINLEGEEVEGEDAKEANTRRELEALERQQKWWEAKCVQYAFYHPHVRARLERHTGTNLVRLTDKMYMRDLQDRIHAVNEENLNRRVAARVLDEMERLKKLILIGKTPLSECPPELYRHPVFVFWRLVNKEVAKARQKRHEAYLRKIGALNKSAILIEDEKVDDFEEEQEEDSLPPELLIAQCREEIAANRQKDIKEGFAFTDEEFASRKYEAEEVKRLRQVDTVEELYRLADLIFGNPKTI